MCVTNGDSTTGHNIAVPRIYRLLFESLRSSSAGIQQVPAVLHFNGRRKFVDRYASYKIRILVNLLDNLRKLFTAIQSVLFCNAQEIADDKLK